MILSCVIKTYSISNIRRMTPEVYLSLSLLNFDFCTFISCCTWKYKQVFRHTPSKHDTTTNFHSCSCTDLSTGTCWRSMALKDTNNWTNKQRKAEEVNLYSKYRNRYRAHDVKLSRHIRRGPRTRWPSNAWGNEQHCPAPKWAEFVWPRRVSGRLSLWAGEVSEAESRVGPAGCLTASMALAGVRPRRLGLNSWGAGPRPEPMGWPALIDSPPARGAACCSTVTPEAEAGSSAARAPFPPLHLVSRLMAGNRGSRGASGLQGSQGSQGGFRAHRGASGQQTTGEMFGTTRKEEKRAQEADRGGREHMGRNTQGRWRWLRAQGREDTQTGGKREGNTGGSAANEQGSPRQT